MLDGVKSLKSHRRRPKARGEHGSRAPGLHSGSHLPELITEGGWSFRRSLGERVQVQVEDATRPGMESGRVGRPRSAQDPDGWARPPQPHGHCQAIASP